MYSREVLYFAHVSLFLLSVTYYCTEQEVSRNLVKLVATRIILHEIHQNRRIVYALQLAARNTRPSM